MKEELKPCPFCGNIPRILEDEYSSVLPFQIDCKCPVNIGHFEFKDHLIKAWNKRST